ncbi:hypothetical protein [Haloarcula amylovorans]|uniref:hypothetical protein n=1 Tax=Haloarcula amylovorans TaxID=2562280 RepID=UPI00142FDF00|nr:hypothetical protein [Halomicroarcula amylolytica]
MLGNVPDDQSSAQAGKRSIIWPEDVVTGMGGEFLGYQMPYKDLDSAKNAFEYTLTELDWESSAPEHRYNVAHNLAVMVAAIHDEGHAIGDFNHDNILIDEDGFVTLIDCDAFHITDGNTAYPDKTYYPRYAPPEGRGGDSLAAVQEADRFCLGVHIFQFLMEGMHPYLAQGPESVDGSMEDKLRGNKFPYVYSGYEPIDSAPDYSTLPKTIRELFKRCFSEVGKNKKTKDTDVRAETNRPDPGEWIRILEDPGGDIGTDSEGDDQLDVVDPGASNSGSATDPTTTNNGGAANTTGGANTGSDVEAVDPGGSGGGGDTKTTRGTDGDGGVAPADPGGSSSGGSGGTTGGNDDDGVSPVDPSGSIGGGTKGTATDTDDDGASPVTPSSGGGNSGSGNGGTAADDDDDDDDGSGLSPVTPDKNDSE